MNISLLFKCVLTISLQIRLHEAFPPVLVVPVPSLPRNASVEVEIISASTSIKAESMSFYEAEWGASQIQGVLIHPCVKYLFQ
jgi:hypothetical protein